MGMRWRPVGSMMLSFWLTLLGACATDPGMTGQDDRTLGAVEPPGDALPAGTAAGERPRELSEMTAEEIAEISRRDVAAFLEQQQPPLTGQPVATTPPPKTTGRQQVMWSTPEVTEEDQATATVAAAPPDASSEGFVAGPLFRTEEDEATPLFPEPPGVGASPAVEALETDRVSSLLVELSRELYRESAYADMPLRELMLIAAQSLVQPDRGLTADAIPGLTQREREVLVHFQSFCRSLGEQLDGSREAGQIITTALDDLREALTEPPRLIIESKTLCYHVGGFGDYREFDRYAFLAHKSQQVIVYLELDGFTSELNEKSQWVTKLSQQLVVYDDRDGIPVWTENWQPVVDAARQQRNDFFTVQVLTLPDALSVGRYHLKIRLRDEQSRAEADGSIQFELVADPKLAAGWSGEGAGG